MYASSSFGLSARLLLLRLVCVDPQTVSLAERARIEADCIAHSQSGCEHQFEQEPERLRLLRVSMRSAVHLQRVVEDRGDFFVRVRFLLVVYGLHRGHLIDKRFFDPPPPKRRAEKATDFREGRGLGRGPHLLRQSGGLERLQVIDGHLSHVDDVLGFQKPLPAVRARAGAVQGCADRGLAREWRGTSRCIRRPAAR